MELLYGTSNPGKLQHMREMLGGLGIEIVGLNDVDLHIGYIDESGNNPLDNARVKALAYYRAAKMPVFSCDSGLFVEALRDEEQPGVHVRRVNGKVLNDEEMIEHYSSLALKLGGELKARYKNAICLVLNEENVYEYDGEDISSESFLIASKAHVKRIAGFPLDSLSLHNESRKYYMDIEDYCNIENDKLAMGFRNFFIKTILK
ncbi:MAG TPA: non-canonical purine NTP pyrophosphatase [Clostridia bacterium]|nr:non-canonical purine NTP pyrophosphatase [Clostridia bacterium]